MNNEKYLNNFTQMIATETISSRDKDLEFPEFQKVCKKIFPNLFKEAELELFHGSMLLKWKGKSDKKPVLFMNHHDVVEATGDWKYPPFSATVADGKVWGRGCLDTKGGLFGMFQAADDLISEGFVPENDIYFESACNEESSGKGAREIAGVLKERGIHFEYLVDEGGMIVDGPMAGVTGKYAMIGLGERGNSKIKFTAKSNGGHASTPGKNTPLVRLGKMMAYFEDHQVFDVEINDVIVEMLKALSKGVKGPLGFVYKHADFFRPLLKIAMPASSATAKAMTQTTLAFTMAQGSGQPNVLPETATLTGDMRLSHHQGFEASLKAVKEVAAKFDVEVSVIHGDVDSGLAKLDSYGFELAKKAVEYSYPGTICAPYIMNQGSDAKSMAIVCDNCLRFSPLSITNEQLGGIHGLNECVDIDNLEKDVMFYKFMMKDGNI